MLAIFDICLLPINFYCSFKTYLDSPSKFLAFSLSYCASGLEIWCVENLQLVPVPKTSYGKFYCGSVYIILHVSYLWNLLILIYFLNSEIKLHVCVKKKELRLYLTSWIFRRFSLRKAPTFNQILFHQVITIV